MGKFSMDAWNRTCIERQRAERFNNYYQGQASLIRDEHFANEHQADGWAEQWEEIWGFGSGPTGFGHSTEEKIRIVMSQYSEAMDEKIDKLRDEIAGQLQELSSEVGGKLELLDKRLIDQKKEIQFANSLRVKDILNHIARYMPEIAQELSKLLNKDILQDKDRLRSVPDVIGKMPSNIQDFAYFLFFEIHYSDLEKVFEELHDFCRIEYFTVKSSMKLYGENIKDWIKLNNISHDGFLEFARNENPYLYVFLFYLKNQNVKGYKDQDVSILEKLFELMFNHVCLSIDYDRRKLGTRLSDLFTKSERESYVGGRFNWHVIGTSTYNAIVDNSYCEIDYDKYVDDTSLVRQIFSDLWPRESLLRKALMNFDFSDTNDTKRIECDPVTEIDSARDRTGYSLRVVGLPYTL